MFLERGILTRSAIFPGYTIHGLEHLTNNTNGLLIFYHILIPVDVAYVTSEVYMATGKIIGGVTHRNLTGYWNFLFRVSLRHLEKWRGSSKLLP